MRQDRFACAGNRRGALPLLYVVFCGFFLCGHDASAQTQQPFLFAATQVNGAPSVATFTRDDAAGTLSEVAGSPFVLATSGCYPSAIDPLGRYLLGPCASGIALYSFNSSTGAVAEVPNSPFAASSGAEPDAVIAESTGQFAYALRITRSTFPTASAATLDSFVIDAAANTLAQPSSQSFALPGTFLGVVADPNDHFLQILLEQPDGGAGSPVGASCGIFFDLTTGQPQSSSSGICQSNVTGGEYPLGIGINTKGTFIVTAASGQIFSSFDIFAISPTDGSSQGNNEFAFSEANNNIITPFFDPSGQLLYVNTEETGLRIFGLSLIQSTVTIAELASSPLPTSMNAAVLSAVPDPAAEFTYVGGSNAITAYPIDPATGYPGAPIQNTFIHNPALTLQPIFGTRPPPGQAISAPGISLSAQTLTFSPINPGQTSRPQTLTISSSGSEALAIRSIAFNPPSGPFSEADTCMAHPVLAQGTSCQISVTYTAGSLGTNTASLVITDNAAGSPQSVTLSASTVALPPPAPEVTLSPGTLTFPGTTTQGESSAPMSVGVTNSGNAALTFSSAPLLSGADTSDFSITTNTCTGSLTANASCNITIVFSPLADGVRTTTLMIADNVAHSPQSVPISGTAAIAATIGSPGGANISVNAGQTAQYSLQAIAGSGFYGTLTFICAGLPTGANCAASNVTLMGGTTTNFSFPVTTSGGGSAMLEPRPSPWISPRPWNYREAVPLLFVLLVVFWFLAITQNWRSTRPIAIAWQRAAFLACLALALLGCGGGAGGGGGSNSSTAGGAGSGQSGTVTPSGTYTITATPSATPNGSSKAIQLNPLTLTLTVN